MRELPHIGLVYRLSVRVVRKRLTVRLLKGNTLFLDGPLRKLKVTGKIFPKNHTIRNKRKKKIGHFIRFIGQMVTVQRSVQEVPALISPPEKWFFFPWQ